MNPKIFVFHCKKKVFRANGVPKNEHENKEKYEIWVPRNRPFWNPKCTPECWFFLAENEVVGANGVPKIGPTKTSPPAPQKMAPRWVV